MGFSFQAAVFFARAGRSARASSGAACASQIDMRGDQRPHFPAHIRAVTIEKHEPDDAGEECDRLECGDLGFEPGAKLLAFARLDVDLREIFAGTLDLPYIVVQL